MNITTPRKSSHDQYDVESPTECWQLNIIAAYCILIFISSFIVNILLLLIFKRSKKMRTPVNAFVIYFTLLSFVGATSEFSFIIPTNIKCRWMWGKTGCYVSGFIMYWVGCTQIYLMAAISLERFIIIFKPMSLKGLTFKMSYIVMAFCSFLSFCTASAPLLGWSYYSLEGSLTSCSIEWAERSFNVISYNIFIFVISFCIPVGIILPSNIKLLTIVKRLPKGQAGKDDEAAKKRDDKERSLTVVMMVYIVGFIISWFPYAMVFLYSAVIGQLTTPLMGTIPSMFAKSSFLWSSLIFIYSSKQVRKKLISEFTGKEVESGATGSSVGHTTFGASASASLQDTNQNTTQATKA